MSLKAGIIGLPNVGKSTLFKAITNQNVLAANYPFATIAPNVGVVKVPDERLSVLSKICQPEKEIAATVEFIDIAGLVAGASRGEGLGNKFLANIRSVDVICEVVRCFEDKDVTHVMGEINPLQDIEIIETELMLADLETINTRLMKIGKKLEPEYQKETAVLTKIKTNLEKNIPVRLQELLENEKEMIKSFNLLTSKSKIFVCNVSEEMIKNNVQFTELQEHANSIGAEIVILSAKIEAELSELASDEKLELLNEVGIKNSGLNSLIKKVYHLLNLRTFFTAGSEEVRAWTFKLGQTAYQCAGIIHTDFQKGFIKAEVMSFDDMQQYGSEKAVQEAGKKRLEGRDYLMKDGDICHFRFN